MQNRFTLRPMYLLYRLTFACLAVDLSGLQAAPPVSLSAVPGVGRLFGLNNSGQIVGHTIGGERRKGIFYSNGNIRQIVVPGSYDTALFGIDDSSRMVGSYADNAGTHGVLYTSTTQYTTLDAPGSRSTIAHGINNAGQIVGTFLDSVGHQSGFLLTGGTYSPIDAPSSVATTLNAINASGTMGGSFTLSSGHESGFLLDRSGNYTVVDVPGSSDTYIYAVSNSGVAVGSFIDSTGTHGLIYRAGIILTFDAPGAPPNVGTFAHGVNDLGQVSAFGATALLGNLQN